VKERLLSLGKHTAGTPPFDASLDELMHSVSEHIHMGERVDFVLLEDQLPYEESVRLAKRYERSKALVPPMRYVPVVYLEPFPSPDNRGRPGRGAIPVLLSTRKHRIDFRASFAPRRIA
jgi:hypothetical protein